uniref:KANL2-like probable zinc-finger domain-containing protein n=1 Tax=Heliothis virescens TaxID=7102 RepID=A0A2A4JAK8_HELVI
MSYLSASENVGFSGIPQNISEASCATQYKMAVEGVSSGSCGEVNMFLHDNSGDEQAYIHLNDNFYSKFKIDPNELYTFHDSDVIAGEITVSHTEDNFIFSDNVDIKSKLLAESPSKELDLIGAFTNGDIKDDIKKEVVSNGHYPPVHTAAIPTANYKESKTTNTKVLKVKNQTQVKEPARSESFSEARRLSVHSPKAQSTATAPSLCTKNSINSASTTSNAKSSSKQSGGMETFLDVFKREQGLVENASVLVKTEPSAVPAKVPMSPPKKTSSGKTSQSKPRRGRGPAVHEALQRIPAARKAIPLPNNAWHAPGDALFQCGPLGERPLAFRQIESSSSDDDNMPDFEAGCVSACVEETAADSRGARLALRRAALRRHVARAHDALALASHHRNHRALASLLKKQLNRPGSSGSLPTQTVNHLLALRGMPSVLTAQERRKLRETGWSGGESGSREGTTECSAERCDRPALAGARYCLAHVTRAADQRLYAACAAVFAGGARCNQPLLPLQDLTPLCAEHAWKRDNYDKLSRDCRPKKVIPENNSLSQKLNVCSNSSTYDSSEEAAMGALSETEYVTVASDSHEMEVEVGHVPPDDILDPAVLSQIPDEAFTEFFNQAEGGAAFAESSELAAALEAVLDERGLDERGLDERVLDERALDSIADCVFHSPHAHYAKNKMQVSTSMPMEITSRVPS